MDREAVRAEVLGICTEMNRVGTLPGIEAVRMLCMRRKSKFTSAMSLPDFKLVQKIMRELADEGQIQIRPTPSREPVRVPTLEPKYRRVVVADQDRPKHQSCAVVEELAAVHRRRRRWGRAMRERLGLRLI
jgi:hypothetical protein